MDEVLYLQNLPKNVLKKDIINLFRSHINDISEDSIHILTDTVGTPNGDGFVEIKENQKAQFIRMIRCLFIGKLPIYAAFKQIENMTQALERQSIQPTNCVCVTGMINSITKEQIKAFFCKDVVMEIDNIRLPNKVMAYGTAYIQLADYDAVNNIINKNRTYWGKRLLEIYKISEKSYNNEVVFIQGDKTEHSVSMIGLPYDANEDDIINFLKPLIPTNIQIHSSAIRSGRSGSVTVYFANKADARKAVKKNFQYMGSRYIEIKLGSRMLTGDVGFNQPMSGALLNKNFSSFGSTSAVDDFVQGERTPHAVFMRGLPFTASNSDVAEFFAPHNPVNIEMIVQPNGTMSGTARVYFKSGEEASASLDKHLQYIGCRFIELKLIDGGQPSGGMFGNLRRSECGNLPVQTMLKPMSAKCSLLNNKRILGRLLFNQNMPTVNDVRCYQTSSAIHSSRSSIEMETSVTAFKGVVQRLTANSNLSQRVRLMMRLLA